MTTAPRVPVSWGELIDKITILEIKLERLHSPGSVANVRRELTLLSEGLAAGLADPPAALAGLRTELQAVNRRLWEIEDSIRHREAAGSFDTAFVALARSVYQTNDERSRIKRAINQLLGSDIVEEKLYAPRPDQT